MKINPFAANLIKLTLITIFSGSYLFASSTYPSQSAKEIEEASTISESELLSESNSRNVDVCFVNDSGYHQKQSAEYFFWLNGINEITDFNTFLDCDLCWHLFIDTLTSLSSFDEETLYIFEIL
jgi:hypothetical protein